MKKLMIVIEGNNQYAIVTLNDVRCIIHDKEKETIKILYSDNTSSVFKDVKNMTIVQITEINQILQLDKQK